MRRARDPERVEPCRCHLDVLPLSAIAARLDRGEKSVLRLHHRLGLPLLKIGPSYFGSWKAIEGWARDFSRPASARLGEV
jgi:hypothetical protein